MVLVAFGVWSWVIWPTFLKNIWADHRSWNHGMTAFFGVHLAPHRGVTGSRHGDRRARCPRPAQGRALTRLWARAALLVAACVTAACVTAACTSSPWGSTRATATPPPSSSAGTPTPMPTNTTPTATPASATQPSTPQPAGITPISAAARADGLVDVRTVVPDAVIDLRYATADNFTGVQLYPDRARCLVHRSMAPGLAMAARRLLRAGYVLVFWDCYRPHAVQIRMFEVVPNPDWVARPGPYARSHESGRSVDVTLARVATRTPIDMGTGFDDFTPRAHAYATQGVSAVAQAKRATLRAAMAAGGLAVYSGEWWHFDGPGALHPRPVLAASVY